MLMSNLGSGMNRRASIFSACIYTGVLFWSVQIAAEFTRLVSADLPKSFLTGLDQYLPRLLELYEARQRRDTQLHSLLESLDSEVSGEVKPIPNTITILV